MRERIPASGRIERAFQIPMRGNEPGDSKTYTVQLVFQIPMWGNEPRSGEANNAGGTVFQIPMRGN